MPRNLSDITCIVFYLCGFAIPVFFMTSGYFLMNRGKIDLGYSVQKAVRILWVVFWWNLILLALRVVKNLLAGNVVDAIIRFPIEYFGGFIQKGFFGAFWYLGALMIIYILLPGLTLLSKNKIRILMQSVLAICVSLYIISLFVGEPVQKYVIQTFRIWTWLFYFLLGGKISNITAWLSERISLKSHGALLAVITVLLMGMQLYVGTNAIVEGQNRLRAEFFYDSLSEMIWVILLFSFVLRIKLSSRSGKKIVSFAKLTMGIYIIHVFILVVMRRLIGNDSILNSFIMWVVTFMCSAIAAWIVDKIRLSKYLTKL